jgi:hypothetical protein
VAYLEQRWSSPEASEAPASPGMMPVSLLLCDHLPVAYTWRFSQYVLALDMMPNPLMNRGLKE